MAGIEEFEHEKVKEKEDYAELLKKGVNSTISKSHKDLSDSVEAFISTVDSESKRLNAYEKETDKRYQVFSETIAEAETKMNKEIEFEKDFWIFENNFIRSAEIQLKQHQNLTKKVLEMWKRANELEIARMQNTKTLYDKVWSAEKVMSAHAKKLCEIVQKTNEEEAAGQLYSFRAFVTPEDLKGLR